MTTFLAGLIFGLLLGWGFRLACRAWKEEIKPVGSPHRYGLHPEAQARLHEALAQVDMRVHIPNPQTQRSIAEIEAGTSR